MGIAHPQFIGVTDADEDGIQVYHSDGDNESPTDSEDELAANVAMDAHEKALSFVRMRVRWATLELLEQSKIAVDEASSLDAESLSKSGTCFIFTGLKAGRQVGEIECFGGDEGPGGMIEIGDSVMLSPIGEFEAAAKRAAAPPAAEVAKSVFDRTAATAAAVALAQERIMDVKQKRAIEVKHTEQMRAYHAHQAHQLASTQSARRVQMEQWLAGFQSTMQDRQRHIDTLTANLARERHELSQRQQHEAQQRLSYLTSLDRHLDELKVHASQAQQSFDDALATEQQINESLSNNDRDGPLVVDAEVLSIRPLTIRCRGAFRSVCGTGDLESQCIQRVQPGRASRRDSSQNNDAAEKHGSFTWIVKRVINASSASEIVEALVLAGEKRSFAPQGWRLDRVTNRVAFDQATKATCTIAAAAYYLHDVSRMHTRFNKKRTRRSKPALPWWWTNENLAGILVGIPSERSEARPATDTVATRIQTMHSFYDWRGVRCVLNQSQREAVTVVTTARAPVTVIQGGFGTGKTAAVAVPILAFWAHLLRKVVGDDAGVDKRHPQILALAQSKANADNLLRYLSRAQIEAVQIGPPFEDVHDVRIYETGESGRHSVDVADSLAASEDECGFDRISTSRAICGVKQEVRDRPRVLVASCTRAAVRCLKDARISHILIDEAARASELTTLPLLSWGCQQLVLVGDQIQATSGKHSQDAESLCHIASLFERLLAEEGCSLRARIPTIILTIQYRSLPAISRFPSRRFYGGSIQDSQATIVRAQNIAGFDWPRRDFPLAFVPLPPGTAESREAASFSNSVEAFRVGKIVQDLINARDVSPTTLGVVTFYAAQVKLLSTTLGEVAGSGVEIGHVSAFQGREKRVIIVSTVRSNAKGEVGILADWQWASIALTRASDALIVVGYAPTMASEKRVWRPWLDWICAEGAVHGKPASVSIAFDDFFSPSLALPVALEAPESAHGWVWSAGPPILPDAVVSSGAGACLPADQKEHQDEVDLRADAISIPSHADAPRSSESCVVSGVSKAKEGEQTHQHGDGGQGTPLAVDDQGYPQRVTCALAPACHAAHSGDAHQETQPPAEKLGSASYKPASQFRLERERNERDGRQRADLRERRGPRTKEAIWPMTAETHMRREAEVTSQPGEQGSNSIEGEADAKSAKDLVEAAEENVRKLSVEGLEAKQRAERAEAAAAAERALADRAENALSDAVDELRSLRNRIFVDSHASTDERAVKVEGQDTGACRQATNVDFGDRAASPRGNTVPCEIGPPSFQQNASAAFSKCAESVGLPRGTATAESTPGRAFSKDTSEDIPASPMNLEQKGIRPSLVSDSQSSRYRTVVLLRMQKLAEMEASVQRQLEAVRAATRKPEVVNLSESRLISVDVRIPHS